MSSYRNNEYKSRLPARLPLVWARLSQDERRIVCQLGQLVPGAAAVPFENFKESEVQQITRGMRALLALARECEFALSYTRQR